LNNFQDLALDTNWKYF